MLKLDNALLDELGLGSLTEEQKKAMLQHIYETLELRVGTDLANQMTDQQLEEFEKFIDDGGDANQAQALQWLESNLPNYKDVVNRVFEELKTEVKNMAPQILASSGVAGQQTGSNGGGQPQDPALQTQSGDPMQAQQQASTSPQQPGQPAMPGYAQPNVSVQPQSFPQQPAYQGAPQQPYYQQPYQQPGQPTMAPQQPQYGYNQPMPQQPGQPYQPPQPGPQNGPQSFPYQQPPAGPGV